MSDKKGLLQEFKEFLATGSLVELAVAVILAGAVGKVISAFTDGVMMNLVAAIFGKPNFDSVHIKISDKIQYAEDGKTIKTNGTYLEVGTVITQLIALILTGLVLFAVVKAYNKMKAKNAAEAGPTEVDLLTEIRDSLRTRN